MKNKIYASLAILFVVLFVGSSMFAVAVGNLMGVPPMLLIIILLAVEWINYRTKGLLVALLFVVLFTGGGIFAVAMGSSIGVLPLLLLVLVLTVLGIKNREKVQRLWLGKEEGEK